MGSSIDFKNNYKTLDLNFIESVWWVFSQLLKKSLVYRGFNEVLQDSIGLNLPAVSPTLHHPICFYSCSFLYYFSTLRDNKHQTQEAVLNSGSRGGAGHVNVGCCRYR